MKSLVVSGTGIDDQLVIDNLEDESVCLVDANTPPSGKISAEWFRLTNAVVAVAVYAFEKLVDAFRHLGVDRNNVAKLFPRLVMPNFLHADNLRRACCFREGRALCRLSFFSASSRSFCISSSVCS